MRIGYVAIALCGGLFGCVATEQAESPASSTPDARRPSVLITQSGDAELKTTITAREAPAVSSQTPIWQRIGTSAFRDMQTGVDRIDIQLNGMLPLPDRLKVLTPPQNWVVIEAIDGEGRDVLPPEARRALTPRPYRGDPDYSHTYRNMRGMSAIQFHLQVSGLTRRPESLQRLVAKALVEVVEQTKDATMSFEPTTEPVSLIEGFTATLTPEGGTPNAAPHGRFTLAITRSAELAESGPLPLPVQVTLSGGTRNAPFNPASGSKRSDGSIVFNYAIDVNPNQMPSHIEVVFLFKTGWRELECAVENVPLP